MDPSQGMENMQFFEFVYMLVVDMMFLVGLVLLMLPLGIWRQAAFAVMKRNFIGYFSNPTGYVFLCLFVLLTSFAAFWPHEFFTTNLANFEQLNKFLPYIMLIFIPAITMSIWAEERRQGTDELLLTLPAKDFDIVIGKYFAAVLVFTVSLLFSQISNYTVLLAMTGGQLDNLLLFSTYLGYWFMGMAMISLGMVASFLTSNLTVGFIFGAAINAPLAFFSDADVIFSNSTWIQRLFEWSLLQQFEPFGRGLISASTICYFLGLAVIGVYLSMILIGRRHWLGGRDGTSMLWHYVVRATCLLLVAVGVVLVVQHSPLNRFRVDISESKISTLSPATIKVLDRLSQDQDEDKPTVKIEAYISNNVPSEYVKTKYDLVNLLREFDVMGGKRVEVKVHQGIEPFSEEAILAEKKYGIRPITVRSQSRGALREEEILLGVAFSSGLERIVIPFMHYGMPVEYELMRSINTVSKKDRKTIGLVQTDALVMGANVGLPNPDVEGGQLRLQIPRLEILSELEKQYNIEYVDAANPIDLWIPGEPGQPIKRRYDVMLVVQPSQTTPAEMEHLIEAIQSGQPTAIFEDPAPNPQNWAAKSQDGAVPYLKATFFPRVYARGGSYEQADIQKLWDALDLDVDYQQIPRSPGQEMLPNRWPYVVWQLAYENPYKRNRILNQEERLIIDGRDPTQEPRFSGVHPATQGIDELYMQFAGYIQPAAKSGLTFEPLVKTGMAGRILVQTLMSTSDPTILNQNRGSADKQFVLAAHIHGDQTSDPLPTNVDEVEKSKFKTNVVYVADIDTLSDFFVDKRNQPIEDGVEYRFQNMSFALNIVDALAGDDTYLGLRNRKVNHVTLKVVEETYREALDHVYELDQKLQIEYTTELNDAQSKIRANTADLRASIEREQKKKAQGEPNAEKLAALENLFQQEMSEQSNTFNNKKLELENERREKKRIIDLEAELKIQKIQRKFKLAAVVIPPIPPLLVGLIVFTRRRLREREGISKARRLK